MRNKWPRDTDVTQNNRRKSSVFHITSAPRLVKGNYPDFTSVASVTSVSPDGDGEGVSL